ncbi:hypothetical protein C453_01210 [Haloferax elongans ATCC BAA-1513]|uniref:Uncharacterized protein n=1 Tax=Haloferax elongans ATCC BAA-1513 TaxID=1230453 RepID=M0I0C4_HALEO|nr:hypothetical protein [Haloferax elongans]ELZ88839.1 hypothetical protein C453_01210 [Haloferax elongans ATCC BAA-1513]
MFREALTEQMTFREIERSQLIRQVDAALRAGYDLDDLVAQTSSMEDLDALLEPTSHRHEHTNE